jgi:hypothetical protein
MTRRSMAHFACCFAKLTGKVARVLFRAKRGRRQRTRYADAPALKQRSGVHEACIRRCSGGDIPAHRPDFSFWARKGSPSPLVVTASSCATAVTHCDLTSLLFCRQRLSSFRLTVLRHRNDGKFVVASSPSDACISRHD